MLNMFGNKMMENGESVHEGSSRSRMEQLALRVLVEDKQEVSRGTLPSAMASITMVRERDKGVLDSVPMNVFSEHDLTVSLPSVFLCFSFRLFVPEKLQYRHLLFLHYARFDSWDYFISEPDCSNETQDENIERRKEEAKRHSSSNV